MIKIKCKNCGETEENHFEGTMLRNCKGCMKFINITEGDLK